MLLALVFLLLFFLSLVRILFFCFFPLCLKQDLDLFFVPLCVLFFPSVSSAKKQSLDFNDKKSHVLGHPIIVNTKKRFKATHTNRKTQGLFSQEG